jgi:16S rRNA (cytosine967-C5)-methyltransferase
VSAVSPAREVAFAVVRATFEDGAFTDAVFREVADERELAGRERAQALRLSYGAVQRRGSSDAFIRRLAERSPRLLDPPVLAALRIGLYELFFSEGSADHATVDQAVELTRSAGAAHATGLVNAVMRRAARERHGLTALLQCDDDPAEATVAHSVPRWLAEMWWQQLGAEGARSLLRACNEPAERALRVNTLRATGGEMIERLGTVAVKARMAAADWPLAPAESIVLEGSIAGALPLVEAGELTPQSRASAAVVEVLGPQPGEHVFDLCAGPGIKTGQIATRMEDRGEVISVERDPARAEEVASQSQRLGLRSVTVLETDAAAVELGRDFDRVLVDAPCSDLGTLASRPDVRWRKSPQGIEKLTSIQGPILRRAAKAVRPGGVLVYSTCTISRAENEDRVAALAESGLRGEVPRLIVDDLGALAPALASPHDNRFLQIRPDRDRTTGFFISRLRRDD